MNESITCNNVRDFGAAGDGVNLDTAAIQAALDACAAAQGGTVRLPAGTYLTGTLYLRSHTALYLDAGAVLLGSPHIGDYAVDTHKQRYANESHMDRCLLYAEGADNLAIGGAGAIDGSGGAFPNEGDEERQRPMLMRFLDCRNIRLNGLRLRSPASWTAAFIRCDTIFADGLDIHSRANDNGDGLDFDACSHVFVSNCKFDTSDDSICLQNSEPELPCRNVVIQNCVMTSRWAGIRIGLLSSGLIEDVAVSNCVLHDFKCSGFKIQSAEGGTIRNLLFSNIKMHNVPRPVFLTLNHFRMGVDAPAAIPRTGRVSHIQFASMLITSDPDQPQDLAAGLVIEGTPGHEIDHIAIRDVAYTVRGGGTTAQGMTRQVPGIEGCRPEYFAFGGFLPAYGTHIRHARDIVLDNVSLRLAAEDGRPAVVCDRVQGLRIDGLEAAASSEAESLIRFSGVRDAVVSGLRPVPAGHAPLIAAEAGSAGILLTGCDLRNVPEPVRTEAGREHAVALHHNIE